MAYEAKELGIIKADDTRINPSTEETLSSINSKLSTGITIGENRWQDAVADGKGFVVGTNNLTISGTAESDFMLIKNPLGSGKTIKLYKANFGLDASTVNPTTFRIYRDPTITANGTALTIRNLKKSGAATAMTAFRAPTISARGSFMASDVFSSIESDIIFDLGFLIEADENILISFDPAVTNNPHHATLFWTEE